MVKFGYGETKTHGDGEPSTLGYGETFNYDAHCIDSNGGCNVDAAFTANEKTPTKIFSILDRPRNVM